MSKRKTSVLVETARRRDYVLEQIRRGATYRQAAADAHRHFGSDKMPKNYDERDVYVDLRRELEFYRKRIADEVEDIRAIEESRLDALMGAAWPLAIGGDLAAITTVLKVMERRARLLGLDAPAKINANVDLSSSPQFIAVRTLILQTLASYPEAREAVASALLEAVNVDAP